MLPTPAMVAWSSRIAFSEVFRFRSLRYSSSEAKSGSMGSGPSRVNFFEARRFFSVPTTNLPHPRHPHPRHRVDEQLRLWMADDAREVQLAAHDGAPGKMRPQVGDDGLDFREFRHYARTTASFFMSAQFGPNFVSTSIPVSSSYAPVMIRGTFSAN